MKKFLLLIICAGFFNMTQTLAQEKATAQRKMTYKAPVASQKIVNTPQSITLQKASVVNSTPVNPNTSNREIIKNVSNKETKAANTCAKSNLKKDVNAIPEYIDTGDPQKDMETLRQAKEEWIKNNPEKYHPAANPSK